MPVNSYRDLKEFVDIFDPSTFGSDSADAEKAEELNHYFVEFPEYDRFISADEEFLIARARKGVGKSALLKQAGFKKREEASVHVIEASGADVGKFFKPQAQNANSHINAWQEAVASCILEALSRSIDTPKTTVELAILRKFSQYNPSKNLLKTLFSKGQSAFPGVGSLDLSAFTALALLEHFLEDVGKNTGVWFLVDDIDGTFRNNEEEKLQISSFFTSIRMLAQKHAKLTVRASVRKDVWTTLRAFDEALDKCQQNLVDIEWSRSGTLSILSNRVRNSLRKKTNDFEGFSPVMLSAMESRAKQNNMEILKLVFPSHFPWGRGHALSYHVIHVLSGGRPRWALQLCKLASRQAKKTSYGKVDQIKLGFITQELPDYSRSRLQDVIIEFRHQCPTIESLVYSFDNRQMKYSTEEILSFISNQLLAYVDIRIDGRDGIQAYDVAAFLFRIGFITGINKEDPTSHYRFEEMPHFFRALPADHSYVTWEVSPAFRAALGGSNT